MIQLRPNTTHRFTVSGSPTIIERFPPQSLDISNLANLANYMRPRKRFIMWVMPDNDIFFDKLDVGVVIAKKMMRAIVEGEFLLNEPRFEIKVNDMSMGPEKYYEVRPLNWKPLPKPSYRECECECCDC